MKLLLATVLIVPIFNNNEYRTEITVTEALGRPAEVLIKQIPEDRGSGANHGFQMGKNGAVHDSPFLDIVGYDFIGNGWARIHVPQDREFHATYTVHERSNEDNQATWTAAPPGRAFRLWGRYNSGESLGLAIVNPTETEQTVVVEFHRTDPHAGDTSAKHLPLVFRGELTIPPMGRVSRFLTEIVILPEVESIPHQESIGGVVRVSGETEIAVAALQFQWRTLRMYGVPARSEPDPEP